MHFLIFILFLNFNVAMGQDTGDVQNIEIKAENVKEGDLEGADSDRGHSYEKYRHRLELRSMRAGVHKSETSSYVFRVKGYGLINERDERKKPLAERQSVIVDIGSFASVNLKPLTSWVLEEGETGHRLEIGDETVRQLVVDSMRKLQQVEKKISVLVEVGLYVQQTKYMVWSEEVEVAKMGYFVIPYTQEVSDNKENMVVSFEENGVEATIDLLWDEDPKTPIIEKD